MLNPKLILKLPAGDREVPLKGSVIRIGRHPGNDVVLADPSVSRWHAVLEVSQDGFVLRDQQSTCGTWVDGKRESTRLLRGGETIRFGPAMEAKFWVEPDMPEVTLVRPMHAPNAALQTDRIPEADRGGTSGVSMLPPPRRPDIPVREGKVPSSSPDQEKPVPALQSVSVPQAAKRQPEEAFLAAQEPARGFRLPSADRRTRLLLFGLLLNIGLLAVLVFFSHREGRQPYTEDRSGAMPSDLFSRQVLQSALDHAEQGLSRYEQGDFAGAKSQFDAALDLLFSLESDKYNRTLDILSKDLAPQFKKYDLAKVYEEVVRYTQKTAAIPPEELRTYAASQLKAVLANLQMDPESVPDVFVQSVHRQIDNFLHKERGFFSRSLERSRQHLPMIVRIFDEMYLPAEIAYVALVESGFNPKARSSAGALGLWQFMPQTARDYGLIVDSRVDERTDPVKSTKAAARYFKNLFMDFGAGSTMLVMAAYNAGEGKLRAVLRRGRNPSQERTFWHLVEKQYLAEETNQYVPRILAAIILAREPARFGFEEVSPDADSPDIVIVKGGTSLEFVARICRTTSQRLLALNPDLPRDATLVPTSNLQFALQVPKGFGPLVQEELNRLKGTVPPSTTP